MRYSLVWLILLLCGLNTDALADAIRKSRIPREISELRAQETWQRLELLNRSHKLIMKLLELEQKLHGTDLPEAQRAPLRQEHRDITESIRRIQIELQDRKSSIK